MGWNDLFHGVEYKIPLVVIYDWDASSLPKDINESVYNTFFIPFLHQKRHSLSPLSPRYHT